MGALPNAPLALEIVLPEAIDKFPPWFKMPLVKVNIPGMVRPNPKVNPPLLYNCTLFGPFVTGHSIVVAVCAVVCPDAPYLNTALDPYVKIELPKCNVVNVPESCKASSIVVFTDNVLDPSPENIKVL